MKNMKVLDLVQGSDEWKNVRNEYYCASDAPAMQGASKYKSRNQLLHEKKTGQREEIDSFKQALFDKGHAAEAAARDIVEMNTVTNFRPLVGVIEIEGVKLLASFDGIDDDGETVLEHKLWNQTLAENVRNGVLDPMYYWQLEDQLLVSGAKRVLFVCSDGTEDNWEELYYESVPERREQLIAGWLQFAKDLETYEVQVKQETVTANSVETFPVITYKLEGALIVSNIAEALPIIKERAEREMSRILETDQDFADKEEFNKATVRARAALKEVVSNAKGEYVSYSEFSDTAAQIDSLLQKMQSQGEKQVKQAKEKKKQDIAANAQKELDAYVSDCNAKIDPLTLFRIGVQIVVDFSAAMKNKRNLESLQNAVDDVVAKYKIEVDKSMSRIVPNQIYLREHAKDYAFLFNDASQIINQETEPFQAIVKGRISDHKVEEERKRELEREQIRKEEETKAKNKIAGDALIASWKDAKVKAEESDSVDILREQVIFIEQSDCAEDIFTENFDNALRIYDECYRAIKNCHRELMLSLSKKPETVAEPEKKQEPAPVVETKAAPAEESTPEVSEDPRAAIYRQAKESFMTAMKIDENAAMLIVEAIDRGLIKNVSINY